MICEVCRGTGAAGCAVGFGLSWRRQLPCPECNGCGIASCCDAAGSAQPVPAWPWLTVKERPRDG